MLKIPSTPVYGPSMLSTKGQRPPSGSPIEVSQARVFNPKVLGSASKQLRARKSGD